MTDIEVKALAWTVGGRNKVAYADAFGSSGFYSIRGREGDWSLEYPKDGVLFIDEGYETQISARRAAQSDYEARIRSALVESSATINKIDILREWFGGERYARDYEYLDANFGAQAQSVVDYLVRLSTPPAAAVTDGWQLVPKEPTLEWFERAFPTPPRAHERAGAMRVHEHAQKMRMDEYRLLLAAAPSPVDSRELIERLVTPHSYAQEYEFRGDGGDYVPTDGERTMIEDAILGYLAALEEERKP